MDDLTATLPGLSITSSSIPEPEPYDRNAASAAVIATTELLVIILHILDMRTLLLSQRVNQKWQAVIGEIKQLQQKLFMHPISVEEAIAKGVAAMPKDIATAGELREGWSWVALNALFFKSIPKTVPGSVTVEDLTTSLAHIVGTGSEIKSGSWQRMFASIPPAPAMTFHMVLEDQRNSGSVRDGGKKGGYWYLSNAKLRLGEAVEKVTAAVLQEKNGSPLWGQSKLEVSWWS